jgi:hypothetical protein
MADLAEKELRYVVMGYAEKIVQYMFQLVMEIVQME